MKWLNFLIKYRLIIGIVFLALAIFTNLEAGFWPSFILYLIAVVAIVGHFIFGPMRLIQEHMESGDIEGAPADRRAGLVQRADFDELDDLHLLRDVASAG